MKPYIYLSYTLLVMAVAGITVSAGPLDRTLQPNGVLNAKYSLPDNAQLKIAIDPTYRTHVSISYDKPNLFGQKHVSYWIGEGLLISRFSPAGDTESPGQTIKSTYLPGLKVEPGSIHIMPTTKKVIIAGYTGHLFHISARINGQTQIWDAVLANGKGMYRLNKAWSRLLSGLGPLQPSQQVAATLVAENLNPELYGYAPLKVGHVIELKHLQNDLSVARIYTPTTLHTDL